MDEDVRDNHPENKALTLECKCNPERKNKWIHKQDNSSTHKSNSIIQWFQQNQVTVVKRLGASPGLIPIENLCGRLGSELFANGREFAAVKIRTCKLIEVFPCRQFFPSTCSECMSSF